MLAGLVLLVVSVRLSTSDLAPGVTVRARLPGGLAGLCVHRLMRPPMVRALRAVSHLACWRAGVTVNQPFSVAVPARVVMAMRPVVAPGGTMATT